MTSDFEMFKADFLKWAEDLLEKWTKERGVSKPPLHIVPEEKLDPWEVGLVYVLPGWRHSGILGAAIICPERYLKDLYDGAVKRNKMKEMWNILKWGLGHEMGHHFQLFKTYKLVVPTPPLFSERIRRGELRASLTATRLIGKTKQQARRDFRSVTGKHALRYVAQRRRETFGF